MAPLVLKHQLGYEHEALLFTFAYCIKGHKFSPSDMLDDLEPYVTSGVGKVLYDLDSRGHGSPTSGLSVRHPSSPLTYFEGFKASTAPMLVAGPQHVNISEANPE